MTAETPMNAENRGGWGFFEEAAPGANAPTATDRAFARLFATPDGGVVLAQLRASTLDSVTPPGAPDAQLRECEGARRLVRAIENRIRKGSQP